MRAYREMRDTHGFARSLDLVAAMSANGAGVPRDAGTHPRGLGAYGVPDPGTEGLAVPRCRRGAAGRRGSGALALAPARPAPPCRAGPDDRRRDPVLWPGHAALRCVLLERPVCQQRARRVALRRALAHGAGAPGGLRHRRAGQAVAAAGGGHIDARAGGGQRRGLSRPGALRPRRCPIAHLRDAGGTAGRRRRRDAVLVAPDRHPA